MADVFMSFITNVILNDFNISLSGFVPLMTAMLEHV